MKKSGHMNVFRESIPDKETSGKSSLIQNKDEYSRAMKLVRPKENVLESEKSRMWQYVLWDLEYNIFSGKVLRVL